MLFPQLALLSFIGATTATKIVMTNDDGWATAQMRAQYAAMKDAGFDVIVSAPAENQSGHGSFTTTPKPLTQPCEFNSCPTGSPPEDSDRNDPDLNYVNGFPVDAVKFGIQTLAPKLFGGPPDLIVSGPNVGGNTGIKAFFSGTMYVD